MEEEKHGAPFNKRKRGKTPNDQWRKAFLMRGVDTEAINPGECDRDWLEGMEGPSQSLELKEDKGLSHGDLKAKG